MVALFVSEGTIASQQTVCDAVSQVKVSMFAGLRQNHKVKVIKGLGLEKKISDAEATVRELENVLNVTLKDAEDLEAEIERVATPELVELEESYVCESHVADDCCEVYMSYFL